jgi:hypothetical protein
MAKGTEAPWHGLDKRGRGNTFGFIARLSVTEFHSGPPTNRLTGEGSEAASLPSTIATGQKKQNALRVQFDYET